MRVGFAGASGTGKSTLAELVIAEYTLPKNQFGSREVSQAMGFASPYDVDAAGKRGEFQLRLLAEKIRWEKETDRFVSDRTTIDVLTYTLLHEVYAISAQTLKDAIGGIRRYTHIIYCPFSAFCDPGNDPARVKDLTYHELYDAFLCAMLDKHRPPETAVIRLHTSDLDERKRMVRRFLST